MGSLLIVALVLLVVTVWVRGTRRNRQRWLEKLDLPGVWRWEGQSGTLEISGDLHSGAYRFRETGNEERGAWVLRGHSLVLTPESGGAPQSYDLRHFDEGKIGLHGPGRERRIYVKEPSNVVPLRRKS